MDLEGDVFEDDSCPDTPYQLLQTGAGLNLRNKRDDMIYQKKYFLTCPEWNTLFNSSTYSAVIIAPNLKNRKI